MNAESVALLSFMLYLAFFGWLGYQRGLTAELIVMIAALAGWFIIEQRGTTVVGMANLGGAGLQFMFAGGFNGSEEEAIQALLYAEKLVPAGEQDRFLYLAWVIGIAVVYVMTTWLGHGGNNQNRGWAVLLGAVNAFFFAIVAMPGLAVLFSVPNGDISSSRSQWDLLELFGRGIELIWDGMTAMWSLIIPLGPIGILVILTGVLIFVAVQATGT